MTMPRNWIRAFMPTLCGRCNTLVPRNTLVLAITFDNVHTTLYRCTSCAQEPAPTDVPNLAPDAPTSNVMERFNQLAAKFLHGSAWLDFNARQAKD